MFVVIGGNSRLFAPVVGLIAHEAPILGTYRSHIPTLSGTLIESERVKWRRLDLSDTDAVAAFPRAVEPSDQALTVVFAAAHIYNALVGAMDMAQLLQTLRINVVATAQIVKGFIPRMISDKSGNFIFISSEVAVEGAIGASAYGMSKAALEGLSASVAKEYARFGIRSNVIRLGYTGLGMNEDISHLAEESHHSFDSFALTQRIAATLVSASRDTRVPAQTIVI